MNLETKCGYVAIVGKPSVGKSTLLNNILGQKISITSRKPQTTRYKILGIKTEDNWQAIYVDTPGLHKTDKKYTLNRLLNRAALSAMKEVDAVIFVVEGLVWNQDDELVLQQLKRVKCPIILIINKVDAIPRKEALLTHIQELNKKHTFYTIIPTAANNGTNVNAVEKVVNDLLPSNPFFFPAEQLTDRNDRFLAAEIIREKLTRYLGEELPYVIAVVIDQFATIDKVLHIAATIIVEKDGQKAIVIGKNGATLKRIGTIARQDMEALFETKVFLQLWVKVKNSWSTDARLLKSYAMLDE